MSEDKLLYEEFKDFFQYREYDNFKSASKAEAKHLSSSDMEYRVHKKTMQNVFDVLFSNPCILETWEILNRKSGDTKALQFRSIAFLKGFFNSIYYSVMVKKETRKQRDDRIDPLQRKIRELLRDANSSDSLDTKSLLKRKPKSTFPRRSDFYRWSVPSDSACPDVEHYQNYSALVLEQNTYKAWPTYIEVLKELDADLDELKSRGTVFSRSKGKLVREEIFCKRLDEVIKDFKLTFTERRKVASELTTAFFGKFHGPDWVADVTPWIS